MPLRCRVDPALDIAPDALVGREVRVYWDGEDAWYLGTVTAFSEEDHLHSVLAEFPTPFWYTYMLPTRQSHSLSVKPILVKLPDRRISCVT